MGAHVRTLSRVRIPCARRGLALAIVRVLVGGLIWKFVVKQQTVARAHHGRHVLRIMVPPQGLEPWSFRAASERPVFEFPRRQYAAATSQRTSFRPAADLRARLLWTQRVSWAREPFVHGGYASVRVGSLPDCREALAAPVADVLFFAGETECPPHYSSWQTLVMLLTMALVAMCGSNLAAC